mmetsp:Transcript_20807/g.24790  ORF Transcript_20807/g.24790 Transcript_20807/m.24790 type:complete len:105 (+) Transcript_20807:114-428(+)
MPNPNTDGRSHVQAGVVEEPVPFPGGGDDGRSPDQTGFKAPTPPTNVGIISNPSDDGRSTNQAGIALDQPSQVYGNVILAEEVPDCCDAVYRIEAVIGYDTSQY